MGQRPVNITGHVTRYFAVCRRRRGLSAEPLTRLHQCSRGGAVATSVTFGLIRTGCGGRVKVNITTIIRH